MKPPTFQSTESCTALSFKAYGVFGDDQGHNANELLRALTDFMEIPYKSVNCSIQYSAHLKIGSWNNGSWDGAIGNITRGEINATILPYPLGTLDDVPVHEGSVIWSTELGILSKEGEGKVMNVGIESWLENFDRFLYQYIALCILLFSSWFLSLNAVKIHEQIHEKYRKGKRSKRSSGKKYHDRILAKVVSKTLQSFPLLLYKSTMAIIDEQLLTPFNFSSKILAVFYFVGIFNLVFGFFLNLISVDMVATQPPLTIDTLADLMVRPEFSKLGVFTLGGLWQEAALKTSNPGSLERKLFDRIPETNFIQVQMDDGVLAQSTDLIAGGLLGALSDGKNVLVLDRIGIKACKSIACQLLPAGTHNFHTSMDSFGERLLVPMISKSSDKRLVTWTRYKTRQQAESHIFIALARHASLNLELQPMSDFKKIRCIEGNDAEQTYPPEPFAYNFFLPLFKLSLYIILLSLIVSLLEIAIHSIAKIIIN